MTSFISPTGHWSEGEIIKSPPHPFGMDRETDAEQTQETKNANKSHTHPFCIHVHHSFQSVLHVMNFIPVREPKKYKNQLYVMIPTLVSRLALCCTVLHVMIHVLMLIPVRD